MPRTAAPSYAKAATAPAANQTRSAVLYEIGPGDKLMIKFFQREELSGEFRVRADGNISLPLIGVLNASGRTPVELEGVISRKFFEITTHNAFPVVDVVERRPFFVTGDVNRAGTYPYVPRMTVVHAVAIAGGIYRLPQAASQVIDITREQWKLRSALADAALYLAKRERLRAQLNRDQSVVYPGRIAELVGKEQADRIARTQRRLFTQAQQWEKTQHEFLSNAVKLADEEIAALRTRLKSIDDTLTVHGDDLGMTKKLFKRGLARRNNLYEKKYAISNLKTLRANVLAEIKRAELKHNEAVKNLAEFWPNEERRLAAELDDVEADYQRSIRNIDASRHILGQTMQATLSAEQAALAGPVIKYAILRSNDGKVSRIEADELTRLLPGDVLKVTLTAPLLGGSSIIQAGLADRAATDPPTRPLSKTEAESEAAPDRSPKNARLNGDTTLVDHLLELKELVREQADRLKDVSSTQRRLSEEAKQWRRRYQEAIETHEREAGIAPDQGAARMPVSLPARLPSQIPDPAAIRQGATPTRSSKKTSDGIGDAIRLPTRMPVERVPAEQVRLPSKAPVFVKVASPKRTRASDMQGELKRIGCYGGQLDGHWGPLSRDALRRFAHATKRQLNSLEPNDENIRLLRSTGRTVCSTRRLALR